MVTKPKQTDFNNINIVVTNLWIKINKLHICST
jgi:hypothetical protein